MYVTNPDDRGGGGNIDKNINSNHYPQHQHKIPQIKIMDYDLAKVDYSPSWEAHSPCGTTSYMAPEVISQHKYGQSIDIWSLGVILYVLLSGKMPFGGRTSGTIHRRVSIGSYEMESSIWGEVSGEAKGLIKRLLQLDPTSRPTAEEIMEDAWLKGENDDGDNGGDGNANDDEKPPGPFRRSSSKGTLYTTTNLRELSSQPRQVYLPPVTNVTNGEGSSSNNNNINNSSDDLVDLNGGDMTGDSPSTTSPSPQVDIGLDNRDTTGTGNEGELGFSLTAALDYDLAPIRQQAEAMSGGKNNNGGGKMGGRFERLISGKKNSSVEEEEEKDVDVDELRVQLSFVGVAAGLGDRRGQDEEKLGGGSPVATTKKKKKKGDMFDDIGGEEVEDPDADV
jgi:serine/threonine protein kinase